MASRIIFDIIRIIFKYGRGIIKRRPATIGHQPHNAPRNRPVYDVQESHGSQTTPRCIQPGAKAEVIAKTMQLFLIYNFNVAPENWRLNFDKNRAPCNFPLIRRRIDTPGKAPCLTVAVMYVR